MNNINDDLNELRDQLRQTISMPPIDPIRQRARALRRRRASTVVAAAMAAAAVVIAVPIAVVGRSGSVPSSTVPAGRPVQPSPPSPSSRSGPPTSAPSATGRSAAARFTINGLDFADLDNAAAVLMRGCGGGPPPCTSEVWVLRNGAWSKRTSPLPLFQDEYGFKGNVTDFGGGRLLIKQYATDTTQSWYSANDGHTWTELSQDLQSVTSIPPDARLQVDCVPSDPSCGRQELHVLLPDTGRVARLALPIGFQPSGGTSEQDETGRWWVGGTDGGAPAVTVSGDAGRSWQIHRIGGRLDSAWPVLTFAGSTAWASVVESSADSSDWAIRIVYRSTNHGASWQRVYDFGTGKVDITGVSIRQGDGLGICANPLDESKLLSPSGVVKPWKCPGDGLPTPINGGYTVGSGSQPGRILVSADGLSWRTLPSPG